MLLENEALNVYQKYGYTLEKKMTNAYAFAFTKGLYNGVDILTDDKECEDAKKLQNEFNQIGYAVEFRNYQSVEDAENQLFKSFFSVPAVISGLKRKYNSFVEKVLKTLPEGAHYSYIKSPYEVCAYNQDSLIEKPVVGDSLVKFICNEMLRSSGPLLIILEAAAGYGKSCTAYEILNEMLNEKTTKLPFFTELSRDRTASIFKHVLHMEIENQFANKVDTKLVINEIENGRVPLIIDGFDELISKDFSFSSSQFESVENMLSTIVDLLKNNAKILITSRKTAIFNSEEFHNFMMDKEIQYKLYNIVLKEPQIDDWLEKDRKNLVMNLNFPLSQAANPVLLSYLRYSSEVELREIQTECSIVDKYFDFLLRREQVRQNLKIEPDEQMEIFKNFVRYMTDFDVRTFEKKFAKEIILEDESGILELSRLRYNPEERPRKDRLADLLTNHAFLDKKRDLNIGMVNDFILGTLVGYDLIEGVYEKYNPKYHQNLSQTMAVLAAEAFKAQPEEKQKKLWNVFSQEEFEYDPQFMFKIDFELNRKFSKKYENATISDFVVKGINVDEGCEFNSVTFTNVDFYDCSFNLKLFHKASFINCNFYKCSILNKSDEKDAVLFFSCGDTSIFENSNDNESVEEATVSLERRILGMYFKTGNTPRHRQISNIRKDLMGEFEPRLISKELHKLEVLEYIRLNGDLSFVTKKGISYFNSMVSGS
ncbi:hypothetical protein SAMN05720472_0382 [Fibrobacter sp. UWR3]|uniref:NACHT domain-containing protein n=1 Tax=Fibrobacter sp. UWR3 TaxID=1896217 RepID=UPI0009130184|nr:hypothetical protein [Fibrobacter sp. UWR3]SHN09736.1 hypothetical protein SAMN05720472_0382 [Fibrobacter sp. UWR3]